MRVAVVIPTKDEEQQIGDCLASLDRQTYPRDLVEVIVVDGSSRDATRRIASAHGARVVEDAGVSAADARNRGIAAAQADILAFTDADCVADAGWLAALVDRFERDPRAAGVGGAIRIRDDHNVWSLLEDAIAQANYRGFITSNVAYRRDVLLEVKGFNPLIRCGEDWDLWWRVLDAGHRVVYEPRALVWHAPEEQRAAGTFLAKQFWYARHDVHTWSRRALRTASRIRRGERAVIEEPFAVMRQTIANAAMAGLLLAAPLSPRAGLAGLALTAAWTADRVRTARAHVPAHRTPAFTAAMAAKGLVRGVGNLVGLAESIAGAARRGPDPTAFRPGIATRRGGRAGARPAPEAETQASRTPSGA